MDYGELLYKAQENERKSSQQEVRCYKSGFAPPKKLERTVSTANVKKFLARKENEEKKKCLVAQKKKEDLLALRNQDKKAKRRVDSMLRRTKSANMSVMEDAIDNNNTADTLSGPMQCDEDDYGYVSQEASALYNKLMNKYSNMPAEPSPFTKMKKEVKDLSAAKDRVRAALRKEEDEADLPHKRKRKTKDDDSEAASEDPLPSEKESKSSSKEKNEKLEPIRRKQNAAPPPPSFQQLLKLAEEKKRQPVDFEKLIRNAPKEPDRPMTQKEKIEWQKEQERKINRERREKGLPPLPSQFDSNKSRSDKILKGGIMKSETNPIKTVESKERNNVGDVPKRLNDEPVKKLESSKVGGLDKIKRVTFKKVDDKSKSSDRGKSNNNGVSKPPDDGSKLSDNDSTALDDIDREIELLKRKRMLLEKNKVKTQALPQKKEKPKIASSPIKTGQSRPSLDKSKEVTKFSNVPPAKDKLIPNSHKPKPPPGRVPPNTAPPNRVPPNSISRLKPKHDEKFSKKPKRRIDSESEEYDSELDDFIEDEDECEDYSSYIKEIFGYDKSRYLNADDDDECMESNFAQQMKEEFVSTKIGIMEDLEDIRQEQEEKKRLKAKKMMKVKPTKGK